MQDGKKAQTLKESIRVSCISFTEQKESYKNMLMWSHYADSHKGVAIGYKFTESFIGKYLYQVKYSEILSLTKNTTCIEEVIEGYFLNKTQDWSYENEYRIIALSKENTDPFFLDFSEGVEIAEVIFGLECAYDQKKVIHTLAKASNPSINFFEIYKNKENIFDLQRKEYEEKT